LAKRPYLPEVVALVSDALVFVSGLLLAGDVLARVAAESEQPKDSVLELAIALGVIGFVLKAPTYCLGFRRSQMLKTLTRRNAGLRERVNNRETELKQAIGSLNDSLDSHRGSLWSYSRNLLTSVSDSLGFGVHEGKHTDRISIYAYDPESKSFTAFGRYCSDPNLDNVKSGNSYACTYGCIGEAWSKSWSYFPDYPEDEEAWIQRSVDNGVPRKVAKAIRMRSRFYCGKRVDTLEHEPLAVIVVESTGPERYTEDEMKEFFDAFAESVREPLKHFKPTFPNPGKARKLDY
jgi:hypothetical protein